MLSVVAVEICSQLDKTSLVRLASICHQLRAVALSDSAWKPLLERDFNTCMDN